MGAGLPIIRIARVKAIGVQELLTKDLLVDILPDWPGEAYPLYVLYPAGHLPAAKVRAFIDFVVDEVCGQSS